MFNYLSSTSFCVSATNHSKNISFCRSTFGFDECRFVLAGAGDQESSESWNLFEVTTIL